jgi:hypothetical protein
VLCSIGCRDDNWIERNAGESLPPSMVGKGGVSSSMVHLKMDCLGNN